MKFRFLGTAAAEGIPALFCQCDVCKRAEAAGGRNIRGRSGAMINDNILIDFPPDIYSYKLKYRLDLAEVNHVFITHSHIDHLDAHELCCYHTMYATRNNPAALLNLYGNAKVLDVIREAFIFDSGSVPEYVRLHSIEPFRSVAAGDVTMTPLTAVHDPNETCVFYLVEQLGKRFLFANDTAMPPEETFAWLAGKCLDVVSLDCTVGKFSESKSHMGFSGNLAVQKRLLAQGSADERTRFISHHFSHNGHVNYDDFPQLAGNSGFVSSYDGMVIEL